MANGKRNMWKFFKEVCNSYSDSKDGPTREELYDHFNRLAAPSSLDYFDDEYEKKFRIANNLMWVGNQYP